MEIHLQKILHYYVNAKHCGRADLHVHVCSHEPAFMFVCSTRAPTSPIRSTEFIH